MKIIFAVFCFVFILNETPYAFTSEKSKVDTSHLRINRELFYQAVEDESQLAALEGFLHRNYSKSPQPIIIAYYGAVDALKAKHVFNPFSKLSYVISALDILEKSVQLEPRDLEIRFIRFSILHHLPGILGYGKERREDQQVIVELLKERDYSEVDYTLQKGIIEFMLESNRLSSENINELKHIAISLAKRCVFIF